MLSVLSPDLSELEGQNEQAAANQFLFDGALLVIAADGVVALEEVDWLNRQTSEKWSGEELARELANPEFKQHLQQRLEANAVILREKLSEFSRAKLLHVMCDVALSAGGIPETEFEILDHLRRLLKLSVELAQSVLGHAKEDLGGESTEESEELSDEERRPVAATIPATDPLEAVLEKANLPDKARVATRAICDEVISHNMPLVVGLRTLVSWAIGASRDGGPLSEAQGKKLTVAAIRVCRDIQNQAGAVRRSRSTPLDKLIRKYGVVALFSRNETVYFGQEDRPYVIVSVSRAKSYVLIAPVDNLQATTKVDPRELRKDSILGDWPAELTEL